MNSITVFICFSFYKLITFYILLRIVTLCRLRNFISFFINKLSDFVDSWSFFLLVDMNSIAVFICFSSYKLITIYILLRIVTLCRLRNFISFFIYKLSDFLDSRSSFLLVDMNSITVFICFSSYKLITIYILLRIFTLCRYRNFVSVFINILSNFVDSRSWCFIFLLVDMFCITFFIFFGSYKFISLNVFIRSCTIFLRRNSLTIFINIFSNYLCSRRSSFLLVDMFCITLIIFFGSYKFISFDIFIRLCTIFLRRNSLTIFINVFSNYFC